MVRLLLRMAWRTIKVEPLRVLVPALLVFGADAFATTGFTELSADHLGYDSLASSPSSCSPRWG
jgi:hypothetical protein